MTTIGTGSTPRVQFIWEIEKFNHQFQQVKDNVCSPHFESKINGELYLWSLTLYPDEESSKSKGHLSISLNSFKASITSEQTRKVAFQIFLLDNLGKKVNIRKGNVSFDHKSLYTKLVCNLPSFISLDHVLDKNYNLLYNDRLTISCEILVTSLGNSAFNKSIENSNNDFESMLTSGAFTDVIFVIGQRKIVAHKNILSSQSKVFASMFQRAVIKNDQTIVEVVDCSYDVMVELLRFIYFEIVENIEKVAKPLLAAAHKYELDSLKSMCETALLRCLNVEEACEILSIAYVYRCSDLKTETLNYVIKNIKEISKTRGFKLLLDTNSPVLADILSRVNIPK